MKVSTLRNKLIGAVCLLAVWFILSRIYPPVAVPPIRTVAAEVVRLLGSGRYWAEIGKTVLRMLTGLGLGTVIALIVSMLFLRFQTLSDIFYPAVEFLQVIPPVSWLILAILWFGLSGAPAIFVVTVAVFAIMTVSLVTAGRALDQRLLTVGKVFALSERKRRRYIILPALSTAFNTSFTVCLGTSVKLIAMAEVMTVNSGIGGGIATARLNLETEGVIAWTVILILLYTIIGGIIKWIIRKNLIRRFWFRKLSPKRTENVSS
ncbi:MAG: ABC transporter permease subunit [Eubacteriales bacterium]|nr:ABC transporter permease subunit [Eubacteriales bacterium]